MSLHRVLPRGNEVLGQIDADRCSCDGDMTVTCSVQLAADLDLSSGHLPDLVDLSALPAYDRADQLKGEKKEQISYSFDTRKRNREEKGQ